MFISRLIHLCRKEKERVSFEEMVPTETNLRFEKDFLFYRENTTGKLGTRNYDENPVRIASIDSLDSVLPVGQVRPAGGSQKNTLFLMESVLPAGQCCRHRSCVLHSASA